MKKILYLIILALFISANSFADLKPLYLKKYETGTKEYVQEYCPGFSYGQNQCIESLNIALKNGYRVTNTFKEDKFIIYMIRKTNNIAMCKVNIKDAYSYCDLVK
jgi:hypothetical protein